MFNRFFTILLFLLLPVLSFSQESGSDNSDDLENLDDLFAAPEEDIVVEEPVVDNRSQFETSEKFKISGQFNALAAIAAGWTDWTFFNDVEEDFEPDAGFGADFKVNLDIRPAPQLNIFASVYTEFDPYSLLEDSNDSTEAAFTIPAFEDLYFDYILSETLYSRIGMFTMNWGQGRFYTPGDLMKDSSDSSLNFRFSLPALSGFSFVLLSNSLTSYKDFTYAGKVDLVFGETMISPGVSYDAVDGLSTLLSFKQVIFKTDISIDFTTDIRNSLLQSTYVVTGFYHNWESVDLYGEYQFSWLRAGGFGHEASIATLWKNPFGAPFNFGAQLEHYFDDMSGTLTLGISQNIIPFVNLKVGLPIVYGEDDSLAVQNNDDDSGRRFTLAVALSLSASF